MSHNILNDISKVYLEQVAVEYIKKQKTRNKARFGPPVEGALQTPKRWWDDDGDGVGYENGEVSGKFTKKKKGRVKNESFSDWRDDLAEVMDDIEAAKKLKKNIKIKNIITINPTIKDSVENLGGTLLEIVELDELDYIVENVYTELLDDGYDEDEIEEALEYALTEAKVTFGHDTPTTEKKKQGLLGTAKKYLSNLKKSAKQAVGAGARAVSKGARNVARKMDKGVVGGGLLRRLVGTEDEARAVSRGARNVARRMGNGDNKSSPVSTTSTVQRKPSTYRGAGAGTKERVSSGSYTPPTQKKTKPAQPVSDDPWKGSATAPKPAAKPAATAVRKRKIDKLGNELFSSIRSKSKPKIVDEDLQPETPQQIAAQNAVLMAQRRLASANQSTLKKRKPTHPLETPEPTG